MVRINKNTFIKIFFATFLFLSSTSFAFASNLSISPEAGYYNVGDVISLRVKVSSLAQSINAVSARINYPQEYLKLTSISKSGSIISLWAQEPSFSNSAGSASFEGVVLSGYTGSSANILTLNFRAIKEGVANVTFVSGSVLANDGEGTNTLESTNQAVLNINKSNIIPKPEISNIVNKKPEVSTKDSVVNEVKDFKDEVPSVINKYYVNELPIEYVYLVIVWVLIMFLLVYLYIHYRYLVKKELIKTKKMVEHSFKILRDDRSMKDLTTLDHDIDDAQKVLLDEIDDIEKI